MAANPAADASASPALASIAVPLKPPPGMPTSRPSPASAIPSVARLARVGRSWPRAIPAAETMTGTPPIVMSVARLTELSAIEQKYAAWNPADSRPVMVIRAQSARPRGQRRRVTTCRATSRPPPASSRNAATDSGVAPEAFPSRAPTRPPAPHKTPDRDRHNKAVTDFDRVRAALPDRAGLGMADRSCDKRKEWVAEAGRSTRQR